MTIITKITRKGNTGYRKIYFSTRMLKRGKNDARRKICQKMNLNNFKG
ncbi:MAG: hypothetical protein HFJ57_00485 [Clostridia bacterium]|nr:hypothetical protein [Clostridia bacterium]